MLRVLNVQFQNSLLQQHYFHLRSMQFNKFDADAIQFDAAASIVVAFAFCSSIKCVK